MANELTENYGLLKPAHGDAGWDSTYNADFDSIDDIIYNLSQDIVNGVQGPAGPSGPPATYKGTWQPTTTYSVGDLVSWNNGAYVSLVNENTNVTPNLGQVTTVGDATITVDTNTTSGVAVVYQTALTAGNLASIICNLGAHSANGSLIFYILTYNGSNSFTITDTFSVNPSGTGVVTFTAGADFSPRTVTSGQYIAYYSTTELVAYKANSGTAFYYLQQPPNTTQTWSNTGTSTDLFAFSVKTSVGGGSNWALFAAQGPTGATGATGNSAGQAGRTLLEKQLFTGNALPTGWNTTSGSWSANNSLISPTTGQGYGVIAYSGKVYAAERRTTIVKFKFTSNNTIMGLVSAQAAYSVDPNLGTAIRVDAQNGVLVIQNAIVGGGWTGGGDAVSTPLGFSIVQGTTYQLIVRTNQREMTVSISDPLSGVTTSLVSGSNATSTGYYQSEGASAGAMLDQIGFEAIAGTFTVSEYDIYAGVVSPRIVFFGDSITHGFGLGLSQRWAQIIANQSGNCLISGRSGCSSDYVLAECTTELAILKPLYMVLLIGTNDMVNLNVSTWEANCNAIISTATSLGIKVVMCTLPPVGANSNRSQSTVNTMNAWILARTDVTIVRFDLALTTNNDGSTQNGSLFANDTVHPNALGAAAMANRFIIDAPFLLDGFAVNNSMLPFGASGNNHSAGAVPDPGLTAGTTRFLREDSTWAVVSGGSNFNPASPGPIGSTTPSSGAFTNLATAHNVLDDGSGNVTVILPNTNQQGFLLKSPDHRGVSVQCINSGGYSVFRLTDSDNTSMQFGAGGSSTGLYKTFYVYSEYGAGTIFSVKDNGSGNDPIVKVGGKTLHFNNDNTVTWS